MKPDLRPMLATLTDKPFDDPDWIFDRGGAIETALKAKEQGKIRYLGFTGHKDP